MSEITLGEIAEQLQGLRSRGATYQSIRYAMERVYWEEIEADRKSQALMLELALNKARF